ncbi:MAG: peroxidase-related enzyme [Pseudomonadales bacterium]
MLTCRDVTSLSSDYLDGTLTLRRKLAVGLHLAMCKHCRAFTGNLRRTIALTRRAASEQPEEVSEAFIERVQRALEERLREDEARQAGESGAALDVAGLRSRGADSEVRPARARLRLVEGVGGDARVARIFKEIEAAQGSVPNLYRVYAHNPDVLETNWMRVRTVMLQGSLSRKLKESIAVVVSNDNDCRYCVEHHSQALLALGVAGEEVQRLLRDPLAGNFEPKERALLALTRQANRDPHGASDAQIAVARQVGTTDSEIIEALAVMELFVSFNRFVNTLEIPLEVS